MKYHRPVRLNRPHILFAVLGFLCISFPSCAKKNVQSTPESVARIPFGKHGFHYTVGSIQPHPFTRAQLDRSTEGFYLGWKSKYLRSGCGPGRYFIWSGDAPGGGKAQSSASTSEGHGYGMMIFALMAGYDPLAQAYFDGMFRYFKDHPAASSPNLMAWNQLTDCTNAPSPYGGSGTATDGDLDIAYALVLADRQWGSGSSGIDYLQEAKNVIRAVMTFEVNVAGNAIFLGDFVTPSRPGFYNGARPSDFMPDHFRVFQSILGDLSWAGVIGHFYSMIKTIQAENSPVTGLIPDFIINTYAVPQPAGPNYLETAYDGEFNYNACRVPWRLATDYLVSGEPRSLGAIKKINTWIKKKVGGDASLVVDGYTLAGDISAGATGPSVVFTAPLAVAAMSDSGNQVWLDSLWSQVVSTPLEREDYYGNTLKMLSMIVISGNWWAP